MNKPVMLYCEKCNKVTGHMIIIVTNGMWGIEKAKLQCMDCEAETEFGFYERMMINDKD